MNITQSDHNKVVGPLIKSRAHDATRWEEPGDITSGCGRDWKFEFASVQPVCDPLVLDSAGCSDFKL